jgi:hypothetical protein
MKKNYAKLMLIFVLTFANHVNAQTPNFNISSSEIIISENDRPLTNIAETITITLSNQPSSTVVVTPTYSDETEFSVSPATLTFTSSNWNTPQNFTFTAINDNTVDGDKTVNVTITATTSSHDSGSGDGSHDSGSGDGSHDSGSGDGSHDSGSGDGSHDSGSGDGSHDSGSGDGSHDSGSGDGSHDSGSGDGSHDSGSGDGSHDSGSGDGSHDSGSGDGSHDSGSGDGSHDSGSGDGSHDSGSGDGTSDLTAQKNLQVRILDFNEAPSSIAGFSVKIGFNTEDYILFSGISDPDGDEISLTTVKALDSGVVELNTGNLLYTPDSKFFGSDSVELKITDGIFSTDVTKINIDVIGLGDMNGDGSVSTVDLVFLASHAVGIDGYEIPNTFDNVFDVNQDGEVNTVDLVYLASNLVGIDGYDLTIK